MGLFSKITNAVKGAVQGAAKGVAGGAAKSLLGGGGMDASSIGLGALRGAIERGDGGGKRLPAPVREAKQTAKQGVQALQLQRRADVQAARPEGRPAVQAVKAQYQPQIKAAKQAVPAAKREAMAQYKSDKAAAKAAGKGMGTPPAATSGVGMFKKGGSVSKRADGIAQRGKTRGKVI